VAAPREIIDALESILGVYFSSIRHRERTAFILCDELVEMSCKLRAREHNHMFDMQCNFHVAWNLPGVAIPLNPLGSAIEHNRNTRNLMQHASAAATVDDQHCADAILDTVRVIDHCWPGASDMDFPGWMKCSLRIVRLYSSQGEIIKRTSFEDEMRHGAWRSIDRKPRTYELVIEPGLRRYWILLVTQSQVQVETILNALGIP
jgi:hypothetical protein